MTFKKLAIALAIVFMYSLSPVAPVASLAPIAPAVAQEAAKPANGAAATVAAADQSTPYGITHLWESGGYVDRIILIILGVMSGGSWYIFFTKWIDQSRVLGQAKSVEKKFWTSATLNEGVEKLGKGTVFRGIAEAGLKASTGGTSLVGLNDWIGMSLTRQLEDANAKLQGGIAFLGSVGSVAPFVGLLGTVMGILNALIGIGVAGQASIDKVAGPVGEALLMTAIGLMVAVPAVLCYNYLVRRNKVITEKLRAFAGDLQAYLISKSK